MTDYTQPISNFLDVASAMLQAEAVREAPKITQRLAGDITIFPITDPTERVVGNTALIDYAKYVYYGTAPHIIRPRNGRALRTPFGTFAQVNHPGTSPDKYLDRALSNLATSGRLNLALEQFSSEMSEEIFDNISRGLRNIH